MAGHVNFALALRCEENVCCGVPPLRAFTEDEERAFQRIQERTGNSRRAIAIIFAWASLLLLTGVMVRAVEPMHTNATRCH